jgi:hypothetical protein
MTITPSPTYSHAQTPEAAAQMQNLIRVEQNFDENIILNLKARMRDRNTNYLSFFAGLVVTTGKNTTAEDCLRAWLSWLEQQGGRPVNAFVAGVPEEKIAAVVREVARYVA